MYLHSYMDQDARFRCKITAYALRGVVSQRNPNTQTAALGMANIAVLAYCPAGQRGRHLWILWDIFPDARDRTEDPDYILPSLGW